MKKLLLTACVLFCFAATFCQSTSHRPLISGYLSYGRHLPNRFHTDSGRLSLISRKMNVSIEGGINLDFPLRNRWRLRTGANAHFLFYDESGYGTTGGLPPVFPADPNKDYRYDRATRYTGQTTEEVPLSCFSIPLKAQYQLSKGGKWQWFADAGAVLAVYCPVDIDDYAAKAWELPNATGSYRDYYQFEINTHYRRSIFPTRTGISPQLEWEGGLEAQHPGKKYGALVFGLKFHVGTNRLDRADYVIWPTLPQYRSVGHYSPNRSYVGLCIGYRFGKNESKK
jgi:hypothetical protein